MSQPGAAIQPLPGTVDRGQVVHPDLIFVLVLLAIALKQLLGFRPRRRLLPIGAGAIPIAQRFG